MINDFSRLRLDSLQKLITKSISQLFTHPLFQTLSSHQLTISQIGPFIIQSVTNILTNQQQQLMHSISQQLLTLKNQLDEEQKSSNVKSQYIRQLELELGSAIDNQDILNNQLSKTRMSCIALQDRYKQQLQKSNNYQVSLQTRIRMNQKLQQNLRKYKQKINNSQQKERQLQTRLQQQIKQNEQKDKHIINTTKVTQNLNLKLYKMKQELLKIQSANKQLQQQKTALNIQLNNVQIQLSKSNKNYEEINRNKQLDNKKFKSQKQYLTQRVEELGQEIQNLNAYKRKAQRQQLRLNHHQQIQTSQRIQQLIKQNNQLKKYSEPKNNQKYKVHETQDKKQDRYYHQKNFYHLQSQNKNYQKQNLKLVRYIDQLKIQLNCSKQQNQNIAKVCKQLRTGTQQLNRNNQQYLQLASKSQLFKKQNQTLQFQNKTIKQNIQCHKALLKRTEDQLSSLGQQNKLLIQKLQNANSQHKKIQLQTRLIEGKFQNKICNLEQKISALNQQLQSCNQKLRQQIYISKQTNQRLIQSSEKTSQLQAKIQYVQGEKISINQVYKDKFQSFRQKKAAKNKKLNLLLKYLLKQVVQLKHQKQCIKILSNQFKSDTKKSIVIAMQDFQRVRIKLGKKWQKIMQQFKLHLMDQFSQMNIQRQQKFQQAYSQLVQASRTHIQQLRHQLNLKLEKQQELNKKLQYFSKIYQNKQLQNRQKSVKEVKFKFNTKTVENQLDTVDKFLDNLLKKRRK